MPATLRDELDIGKFKQLFDIFSEDEALLAARGFYHDLYASQFEEALDPVA